MKKIFHNIVSVFLAFVVFFSTMSFTVDKHYCGDTLVGVAIFKEAKSCGMEMDDGIAPSECSITKKNCCTDSKVTIEGQDHLQLSFHSHSLDQQLFLTAFVHSYIYLFTPAEAHITSYEDYMPPPFIRQIYKLDESYII